MESDKDSTSALVPNNIEDVLLALSAQKVSAGTDKGFFLPEKALRSAEKRFQAIVQSIGQDAYNEGLNEQAQELAQLKESHLLAKKTCAEAEEATKTAKASLDKARAELSNSRKSKDSSAETAKVVKEYKVKLADLELELGKAKARSKSTAKGFDPAELEARIAEEDSLRATVKTMQAQRKELETQLSKATAQEQQAAAAVLDWSVKYEALAKQAAILKSKAARAQHGGKIEERNFTINVPLAKLLIGDKGMEFLKQLDVARRENLRDYAYTLMQAANSGTTTKGIGGLLALALQWLKQKTFAAREVLRPWLERISQDLSAGVVNSVRFYRDLLRQAIGDFKAAKIESEKAAPNRSAFLHYAIASINGASKFFRRGEWWRKPLSTFRRFVRRSTLAVKRFWKGFPRNSQATYAEKVMLFDAEEFLPASSHERPPS